MIWAWREALYLQALAQGGYKDEDVKMGLARAAVPYPASQKATE